ncbi:MAG: GNAT family N-acetyltransferase [Pseudomonadota bacterium]
MVKTTVPSGDRAPNLGVSYRNMTESDMTFLCALYYSTRAEEMEMVPWTQEEKDNFIDMQFKAQHQHYQIHYPDAVWLVIEIAGERVGRLYLEHWETQHCVIDIALMPEMRGKGIGNAIMQDVIEQAAGVGRDVCIHVEKNNPAMRLYKNLGFKVVEDKGVYDLMVWSADQAVGADQENIAS